MGLEQETAFQLPLEAYLWVRAQSVLCLLLQIKTFYCCNHHHGETCPSALYVDLYHNPVGFSCFSKLVFA